MTQNQTIAAIRALGLSCTALDGEFRVNTPRGPEATAHYTTDREDALGTARMMVRPAYEHTARCLETGSCPECPACMLS